MKVMSVLTLGAKNRTVSMNLVIKRVLRAMCLLVLTHVANVHAETLVPADNPNSIENDPSFLKLLQSDYYPDGLNGDVIRSLPIDLNGDGQKEWVVELGKLYCITEGCRTLILKQDDAEENGWKKLFDEYISFLEYLGKDKNGWLELKIGAGAIRDTYIYDGDAYILKP